MKRRLILPVLATCWLFGTAAIAGSPDMSLFDSGRAADSLLAGQTASVARLVFRRLANDLRFAGQAGAPDAAGQRVPDALTRFSRSPEIRRADFAAFAARTHAVSPADGANLQARLARIDLVALADKQGVRYGLRGDDVADAFALWWVCGWQAANLDRSDPSSETVGRVHAQAARALAATPEFVALDDAQRQELDEALTIEAMLISNTQHTFEHDHAKSVTIAQAVAEGAKAQGLDLAPMTLTDDGFVAQDAPSAPDEPKPPFQGDCYVSSQMEMVAELCLGTDGRFRYGLTVGDLDERAVGRWVGHGSRLRLLTEPKPVPPAISAGPARLDPGGGLKVKVVLPNGRMIGDVDLVVGFDAGDPIEESVGLDRTSADGAIWPEPKQSWTLPPGEARRPRWVELSTRGGGGDAASIAPTRFPVDVTQANDLTFVLHPNDMGVLDFANVRVRRVPDGIMVERGGKGVVFRPSDAGR